MRDTFPLCPKCLAFAAEGGRDTSCWAREATTQDCGSLQEGGCLSTPAKPTEPYECFRLLFDLTLDTGEVAPMDITGSFDPEARTFTLDPDFFQCQRTDGPDGKYGPTVIPTETEAALVTAAACAEWDAIDWEADRLAYRRARREDEDTQFQMGWDAYGQE